MKTILSEYIYSDVFSRFKRLFKPEMLYQNSFVSLFAKGLMPRIFRYEDQADRIIYDENQEVGEMYFLREG